jgi:hypothetical protein
LFVRFSHFFAFTNGARALHCIFWLVVLFCFVLLCYVVFPRLGRRHKNSLPLLPSPHSLLSLKPEVSLSTCLFVVYKRTQEAQCVVIMLLVGGD